MRFKAYGHRNVRGTHKTTFEITKDPELTERGTCIIGVNSDFSVDSLKKFTVKNNRVKIKLSVDNISDEITGDINKEFSDDKEIVFRMGEHKDKRTLVNHTDKSAMYLNKALIELMKNPESTLIIELTAELKEDR